MAFSTLWIPALNPAWVRRAGMISYLPRSARVVQPHSDWLRPCRAHQLTWPFTPPVLLGLPAQGSILEGMRRPDLVRPRRTARTRVSPPRLSDSL